MSTSRISLPWITRSIKRQMRKRDNLLKKARSTGDKRSPAWLEYRCQRNKVVKLLKTAHNDYRKNVIGGSLEENPKRFWSYIKRLPSTNFGIPWRHVPTSLLAMMRSVFIQEYSAYANLLEQIKRNRLHNKRVQLPQDWFGTRTWPLFHSFGTPIWPPWRHVKTFHRPIIMTVS